MKTYILILIFLLSTCLFSTIINVPADQPTIQAGINASVDTDTVLVQSGTYFENINYNGKLITVASLFLTTQDTTYISSTVIDGDESGSVVIFENGENEAALLTGFSIINGCAVAGGGISCIDSSPFLNNLTITDNRAVAFWGNGFGGGISIQNYSHPRLENVTITDNVAGWEGGGGLFCSNSDPILVNVFISNNHSSDLGVCGRGGICCWDSNISLDNVTIANNSGGIACFNSCPNLKNVLISGNSCNSDGSGIFCSNSSPILVNVSISNNSAVEGAEGGGIYCEDHSNPILTNCILSDNYPQEVFFAYWDMPNTISISYSNITGGEAGIETNNNGTIFWLEGNIDEDPLFVGTGEDPYSLLEDSPCIDTGDPDALGLNLPPWDIIGNERIWDGDGDGTAIIDMGAYEYGAPPYVEIDDDIIVQTPGVHLYQNYPNPFNPAGAGRSPVTTIRYQLAENSKISLKVYNIKGQFVKTLVNEFKPAGEHSIIWDGKDQSEHSVPSGIYFYRLKTKIDSRIRKMVLLR